eukprot:6226620-Lingulodinium_polyedra.AAC.1
MLPCAKEHQFSHCPGLGHRRVPLSACPVAGVPLLPAAVPSPVVPLSQGGPTARPTNGAHLLGQLPLAPGP